MGRYTKKDAIRIVSACAAKYKENLVNKSLLFVCQDKHKRISTFEFTFTASNFLHLTGLKLKHRKWSNPKAGQAGDISSSSAPQSSGEEISALDFYSRCLDHALCESDFDFARDGTTEMKLDVLSSLLSKNLTAKMIGNFLHNKLNLNTDKLAGGATSCMGFIKDRKTSRYVPNTIIKADIRKHTASQLRIIACYRKPKPEPQYNENTYQAKNVDWDSIAFPAGYEYLKTIS